MDSHLILLGFSIQARLLPLRLAWNWFSKVFPRRLLFNLELETSSTQFHLLKFQDRFLSSVLLQRLHTAVAFAVASAKLALDPSTNLQSWQKCQDFLLPVFHHFLLGKVRQIRTNLIYQWSPARILFAGEPGIHSFFIG